jgi:hypothetical protein
MRLRVMAYDASNGVIVQHYTIQFYTIITRFVVVNSNDGDNSIPRDGNYCLHVAVDTPMA